MARRDLKEYRIWKAMKARCYAPSQNRGSYKKFGIQVCDAWKHDFEQFLADMGPIPGPDYSIERIDVFGDYCPENCKWIPLKDQSRNRSNCLIYSLDGETHFLKDWARIAGIKYTTLYMRIFRDGLTFEQAISKR